MSYEILLNYSEHRPKRQAWRAASEGHITYAPTREAALSLHDAKLASLQKIEQLMKECASFTVR